MRPLGGLLCLLLIAGAPVTALATDRIDAPPATREFRSPSGRFRLTLLGAATALATLRDGTAVRWRRPLPHERGPRTAVVADSGAVLLVDEWINVVPRHALMLIARDGRVITDISGERLFAMTGGPRAQITAHARSGAWLAGEPTLERQGRSVAIRISSQVVHVSLSDGSITVGEEARAPG